VGYAVEARWSGYQATVERALQSFRPLSDPVTLSVQPQRVDLIKLDQRTTIEDLARKRASPVSVATLALINQVQPQALLEPGRFVKWIVGAALP